MTDFTRTARSAGLVCLALALTLLCAGEARGQAAIEPDPAARAKLRVRKIEGTGRRNLLRAPIFQSNMTVTPRRPMEWGQVRIEYDTAPAWIDELVVQHYVLLQQRQGDETRYLLLKGTVAYVDVAAGTGHVSVMYVRPQTLLRHGEIVAVATEVFLEGKLADMASESLNPKVTGRWWDNPNVPARDGHLLNRDKSPFALINIDEHEAIRN